MTHDIYSGSVHIFLPSVLPTRWNTPQNNAVMSKYKVHNDVSSTVCFQLYYVNSTGFRIFTYAQIAAYSQPACNWLHSRSSKTRSNECHPISCSSF